MNAMDHVAVLREAFIAGANRLYLEATDSFKMDDANARIIETAARARYPMPIVEIPRVVEDSDGFTWRIVNGRFECRLPGQTVWGILNEDVFASVTLDRVRLLPLLLQEPTIKVYADDPRAKQP